MYHARSSLLLHRSKIATFCVQPRFIASRMISGDRQESYDFLVKKSMLQNEEIKNFISVLKSDDFREKTAALGGYTFDKTGEIILV